MCGLRNHALPLGMHCILKEMKLMRSKNLDREAFNFVITSCFHISEMTLVTMTSRLLASPRLRDT